MIVPYEKNFTFKDGVPIRKGGTFEYTITYFTIDSVPVNLTGYTIEASIRSKPNRSVTPIVSFTVEVTDGALGYPSKVKISISDELTLAITDKKGYWDLKATNAAGDVDYFMSGKVDFVGTVTE